MRLGKKAVWVSVLMAGSASAAPLFDASLGTTPSAQGWPLLRDPILGHSVSETLGAGFTALDSRNPISDKGGYFSEDPFFGVLRHPAFPATLDRVAGFTVRVDLRIVGENHPPRDDNGDGLDDRAGFSLIVVTDDLSAIEIGFWDDQVWAYEDDAFVAGDFFTHAESALLDTTAQLRSYALTILGDRYTLRVDGATRLSGPLRDYSSFTGSPNVYAIANFAFFGDDTSSAEGAVELAYYDITDDAPPHCPADLNFDGVVDLSDLAGLLAAFGACAGDAAYSISADLNNDGCVELADLAGLLAAFGTSCG
ncbi:MAG: hypothetical protein KDA32_00980 [Phycisphaerales bacterium]|nr:hypothetical protein [Phycisphaerales bacterium]